MRLVDTDVVWTPGHGVRVELHGTNWDPHRRRPMDARL